MSLFEVVRIWDAWPRITGSQVLRDLFRQVPTRTRGEKTAGVFISHCHLFIATVGQGRDQPSLHCFSCCPTDLKSVSNVVPLEEGRGVVVRVFCVRGEEEAWVVRGGGDLELYSLEEEGWKMRGSTKLGTFQSVEDCVVHASSHRVVYCEKMSSCCNHSYQISARMFEFEVGVSVKFGDPTIILTSCPQMNLYTWEGGIALSPSAGPAPPGLLLFWLPQQRCLKSYVCNIQHHVLDSSLSSHYPTLCLRLAPLWAQAMQEPHLVSAAIHPVTNQLLLLMSSGEVREVRVESGILKVKFLVQLSDFSYRYRMAVDLLRPDDASDVSLRLFAMQTYYGIFKKGEMRLYDSFTGEFVWECDEHEGSEVHLLSPPMSSQWCGFYSSSGVWVLRSRRLAEQAQLMAQALFPITTNADETTPGDYLEHGRVLAARLCQMWGLHLPVTRYALEAVHGTVQQDRAEEVGEKEEELFLPELPLELMLLLKDAALQDPALLVALLSEHPSYRQFLRDTVSFFLNAYHSEDGSSDKPTPLNSEVVTLLESYHSLCEAYDYQFSLWQDGAQDFLAPERVAVNRLLQQMEAYLHSSDVPLSFRAQLLSLYSRNPKQVLEGIKDFFQIQSFREAVEELQSGVWHSERNWKSIFGTENGSSLHKGIVHSQPPNISLFELVCRLLYEEEPQEVIFFVRFAQLARDHQVEGDSAFARKCRKTYFFHRTLECLPGFVSYSATPVSRDSLVCRSHLLLQSEHCGRKVTALQLLLCGKLWEEALSLVESIPLEDSTTRCALFHLLLTSMVKENTLHHYVQRVWNQRPNKFSVFDFLNILQTAVHGHGSSFCPTVLVHNSSSLMMSHISEKLEKLLESASNDRDNDC